MSLVECGLDGGAWTRCYTPTKYTGLSLGRHTFCVRAVDRAKNVGQAACYAWTIEEKPVSAPAEPPPADPGPAAPPPDSDGDGEEGECPPGTVGC